MLHVINRQTDPYFNMAAEEYVLTHLAGDDDCFMLWQNRPAIILGRNQNAWEEINSQYVREQGIAVVRRLTGGGAVYHDLGNLNFTFIVHDQGKGFDFHRFGQPIINALARLGVQAEMSGRNDILIAGHKFSGNAEYRYHDRLLHHGTLLFDCNLGVLSQALQVKPQKIASKGVKSVRSRVTNIKQHLPRELSLEDFRQAVLTAAAEQFGSTWRDYHWSEADLAVIAELQQQKYSTWQWNFGQAPAFNVRREKRYPFGEVDIRLQIERGHIVACHIFGDFFSNADVTQLAARLQGAAFSPTGLQSALEQIDVGQFIPGLDHHELLDLLLG
ncbi:MAG: lipoate--protein ligase [Bacillota bacterium]|jgi:lipoate-protein ligase A